MLFFYAFLALHFLSAILYVGIIYESLFSPPGRSHHSSPCMMYSRPLPAVDRTIPQPLPATWGQDKGPGSNPLALSSKWIDEGAAASPGRTWKTGKSLLGTCDVPLPLEGVGLATSVCCHSPPKWWQKLWMASPFCRSTCMSLGKDIQPGAWCY